jgi:NADH dehydrogenase
VLVLGGTGFIGRHVVAALAARGHEVRIGTRRPARARRRLAAALHGCELREVHFERLAKRGDWHTLLAGCEAVVNAVGILRERGSETYDRVHHGAPAALAAACALAGRRLVHVSALGLSPAARSGFLRSKLAGERAIAASGAPYSIVRPSLLDGEGGYGAAWLRWFARWPLHFVPADARGRIAVLHVTDLAEAIAALCEKPASAQWREVELGGIAAPTMSEYLIALRTRPALRVAVPAWLARVVSHVCDALHFSPFSFGHLELLRQDNVPRPNSLPALLGRAPLVVVAGRGEVVDHPAVALRRPAL